MYVISRLVFGSHRFFVCWGGGGGRKRKEKSYTSSQLFWYHPNTTVLLEIIYSASRGSLFVICTEMLARTYHERVTSSRRVFYAKL